MPVSSYTLVNLYGWSFCYDTLIYDLTSRIFTKVIIFWYVNSKEIYFNIKLVFSGCFFLNRPLRIHKESKHWNYALFQNSNGQAFEIWINLKAFTENVRECFRGIFDGYGFLFVSCSFSLLYFYWPIWYCYFVGTT